MFGDWFADTIHIISQSNLATVLAFASFIICSIWMIRVLRTQAK